MRATGIRQLDNRPVFQHERDLLMIDAWAGLCCLATEQASANEWRDAADAFNVVETLFNMGKLDEHVGDVVRVAQEALKRSAEAIADRRAQSLDDTSKVALLAIGHTYYGALKRLSRGTVHDAIQKVIEKTNAARVRYIPGVEVICPKGRPVAAQKTSQASECVVVD